jgi:hypothetical protein
MNQNKVIEIKSSPKTNFFRLWCEFIKPIHNLTNREMDVLAGFLKERYELSKGITDNIILDKVLMSEETKRKIRLQCDISSEHFQIIMSKLRKNKVVVNNMINPKLIPNMPNDDTGVGLLIYFNFKDEQHITLGRRQSSKESEY